MKSRQNHAIPQHDYGPALQRAVSWLGERYLLAEPVVRRSDEPKPYFTTPRNWLSRREEERSSWNVAVQFSS